MVIFSSCWKHIAFADWMGQRGRYSRACPGTRFRLVCVRAFWRGGNRSLHWIARCEMGLGGSSKSAGYERPIALGIQQTEKMAGPLAGHLPM